MSVRIRKATRDDLSDLSRLNRIVQAIHVDLAPWHFRDDLDDEELHDFWSERLIEADSTVAVAEVDDRQVVGSICFEVQSRPRTALVRAHRRIHVHQIVVDPRHRRMGVGSDLLRFVEAEAKVLAVDLLSLSTWLDNTPAQSFFAALSFKPLTVSRGKDLSDF